ncbi:MAG: DUF86 domain-containing protein, partial [Planctomycetota bacterium]
DLLRAGGVARVRKPDRLPAPSRLASDDDLDLGESELLTQDTSVLLEDILAAIVAIHEYTLDMELSDFVDDRKTVDAVVRNLEVIGEAARKIPEEVKSATPSIEWRKLAGLRNMLAHEYFRVDETIVWDVVLTKLPPLEREVRRIMGG